MRNPSPVNLNDSGLPSLASRFIQARPWRCERSPEGGRQWLNALAEMALGGDRDALRVLPAGVEHLLAAGKVETGATP